MRMLELLQAGAVSRDGRYLAVGRFENNGSTTVVFLPLDGGERWETLVPVPQGKNVVYYRFKFDYRYNSFGPAQPDSKLSAPYRLLLSDK